MAAAALLLAAALTAGAAEPTEAERPERKPGAAASWLVWLDGEVLWSHAPDVPRAPASLTKIMTALLALEAWRDDPEAPRAWIAVSPRAAAETGSRLGLRAGEELRAGAALEAMLVASANDACVALAEHVGGSVERFVARMNGRAAELGLAATHFVNPCGHDAPGHVSTALDLLRLTRVALEHPEFARIVALPESPIRTRGGRRFTARTSNGLIGRFPGVSGIKTGRTARAGDCLIARASRDGAEAIVVLLGSEDRWWSAAALLEAALREGRTRG